jgi:hypothetical protein
MTFLKSKTNQIFLPSSIINSPLNPNTEMMVLMRPYALVESLFQDSDTPTDENVVAKRFQVKVFQFISKDPQQRVD